MALLSKFMIQRRHHMLRPYLHGDVLDVGCGRATTCLLLDAGQRYTGIELDCDHVEKLRRQWPQHTFYCRDLDREQLDLDNKPFGTIVFLAVIEHLVRPKQLLSQFPAYMTSTSRLLVTTPSFWGDKVLRVGVKWGFFHPDGVTGHQAVYGKAEMSALLADTGLCLVSSRTFLFGTNQLFVCRLVDS